MTRLGSSSKLQKKCLQFCSNYCKNFGIEQVSPKHDSYLSLEFLENLTTVKFPPPVFIIPERSLFSAKYIFSKQWLTSPGVYHEEIVGYLFYIFGSYLNNECWHHNSYQHKKKDHRKHH